MQESDIQVGDLVSWHVTVPRTEMMGIVVSKKMRQLNGVDKDRLIRVVFSGDKKYWLLETTLKKVG
jgi:hypothetical protein